MQAIVFDFDGTILDTESACYNSWAEVYRRHGGVLPLEKWAEVIGTSGGPFDPWEYLEQQVGHGLNRHGASDFRRRREREMMAGEELRPGVLPLLQAARAEGLAVGLATSSQREWVQKHLEPRGLLPYFDAIVTADDVERTKPDPRIYTLVAERLGVDPADAVALEDSPNGALGAKRAGFYCIVVPNAITKGYDFPMADARLETLAGITLYDLRKFCIKAG